MLIRRYRGFGLTYKQMQAAAMAAKRGGKVKVVADSGKGDVVLTIAPSPGPLVIPTELPEATSYTGGTESGGYTSSEGYSEPTAGMSSTVKAAIGAGVALVILGGAYAYSRKR